MLKCPACDATLEQDYGLVTCVSCKAMLMIEMSGEVKMGSEAPIAEDTSTNHDFLETAVDDDVTDPPEESITEPDNFEEVRTLDSEFESSDELSAFADADGFDGDDGPIESDFESVMQGEADDGSQGDDEVQDEDFQRDSGAEFTGDELDGSEVFEASDVEELTGDPVDEMYGESSHQEESSFEEEAPKQFAMPTEPDPNPVDITDFANSEVSNLEEGELLYDVIISRIDSKDLKEALKYVLIDEKLKLNYHEYLKNIKDGTIVVEGLNPIKAKRIVEQLQYYDLEIKWVQRRVIMDTVEPEMDDDGLSEGEEDANV